MMMHELFIANLLAHLWESWDLHWIVSMDYCLKLFKCEENYFDPGWYGAVRLMKYSGFFPIT